MYRVDSDENTADFFTKGSGGEKHTKFGSQSLGYDLSFLYRSRKYGSSRQKEGEQIALLSYEKEGEPKLAQDKHTPENGLVSCGKEGELTIAQNDPNTKSRKELYMELASKAAQEGNESKFNMFFKLLKFVGHVQTQTSNERDPVS